MKLDSYSLIRSTDVLDWFVSSIELHRNKQSRTCAGARGPKNRRDRKRVYRETLSIAARGYFQRQQRTFYPD